MTALIVLTAVLLLASGLVKVRTSERVGAGLSILALLEILAGLCLAGAAFLAPPTERRGLTWILVALGLLVVSSIQAVAAMRKRSRTRELSEGARLRTYLQVLSSPAGPRDPSSSGKPGAP